MKIRGIDIGVKPCPFCGSTNIDFYETDFGRYGEPYYCVVKCDDCNANIFAESGYLEDAFELWNRRA